MQKVFFGAKGCQNRRFWEKPLYNGDFVCYNFSITYYPGKQRESIEGAFGEIRKYAEKHKTGNFAFVPPEKALEIVSGYYGLDMNQPEEPQAPAQRRPEADDLDLDALLGGL